jgi:osmotically-inducible protein OsmY
MKGVRLALALVGLGSASLAGTACAPLVVGGTAGAVMVSQDRRTTGTQVEDQTIEWKVSDLVRRDPRLTTPSSQGPLDPQEARPPSPSHVVVTSYNGVVLLAGEVPDESAKADLAAKVRAIDKVRNVHDELTVGPPSSPESQSGDVWLKTQVAGRLVLEKNFDSDAVKVNTVGGTAYLMGLVSRQEAHTAAEIARTTDGVRRVVLLFEYLN